MPTTTILTLKTFDPANTDPIPQGEAHIDAPNHLVRISIDDVPATNGGYIEITALTIYVRGSATHNPTQNLFANAEQGASDGIFQLLVSDESLISNYQADLRALSELSLKVLPQYQLSFTTRVDGFKVGQTIRFIDQAAGINALLTIQSVNSTLVGTTGLVDEFEHSIQAAPYILDPLALVSRAVTLSSIPNQPRNTIVGSP